MLKIYPETNFNKEEPKKPFFLQVLMKEATCGYNDCKLYGTNTLNFDFDIDGKKGILKLCPNHFNSFYHDWLMRRQNVE